MAYRYTESGLDNVFLENGVTIETHPAYGELISIVNVRGLHAAIGTWLIRQARPLNGAEFRFLRVELDLSQRALGTLLGVTEQAIAKWEKARAKPVASRPAERLLRVIYSDYVAADSQSRALLDELAKLDAERSDLHMRLRDDGGRGWAQAA